MSARTLLLWSLVFGLCCVQNSLSKNLENSCKSSDCVIKCCPKKQIYFVDLDHNETRNCVDSSELIKRFDVKDPNNYSEIDFYNKNIKQKIIKTDKSVNWFKFVYVANFIDSASNLGNLKDLPHKTYFLEVKRVYIFKYLGHLLTDYLRDDADIERERRALAIRANMIARRFSRCADGKFVLRRLNYWNQWTTFEPGQFCIEHEVTLYDGELGSTTPDVVVWVLSEDSEKPPSNNRAVLSSYGLLVSCVFLLLVLVVYALLPELRNLAGLILMACMATCFGFFLTRVIHVFGNDAGVLTTNACIIITIIFHYLMLSTFCWMNVMSFDIWWTFRGMRKASQIHRRGGMSKFRRYCAYAWGVPVLPTLFVVIVDQLDLSHLPNFVKPHIFHNMCYFEPEVHLLYVSIPILILICVNVVLFLLTAYNIWEVNRGVTLSKDSAKNKQNESHSDIHTVISQVIRSRRKSHALLSRCLVTCRNVWMRTMTFCCRFWVYLRLSLVMGVSWILEVIGNLVDTQSPVWSIADLYNALVGLFIFLLFVCKKKIFLRLCTRLSIDNKLVRWVRARDDSPAADAHTKSTGSQHTDASEVEPCALSSKEIRNRPEDI